MIRLFKNSYERYKEFNKMISDNISEIRKYNAKIVKFLSFILFVLMAALTVVQLLNEETKDLMIDYLIFTILILLIMLLFHFTPLKKHPLLALYMLGAIFLSYGILLSVVFFPDERATTMIALLYFVPLFLIDRPERPAAFVILFSIIHLVLVYHIKSPDDVLSDFKNCISFGILGASVGYVQTKMKLRAFEAQRLLDIERKTDYLTGLRNRNLLVEQIDKIKNNVSELPYSIMMLDIDDFKKFNDTYGHAAGDKCLSIFGGVLQQFEKAYKVVFYRYGGEEFTAFMYEEDPNKRHEIAEEIRIAVGITNFNHENVTVSIGAVECSDKSIKDCDIWIEFSDKALYEAKRSGRNKVVFYAENAEY